MRLEGKRLPVSPSRPARGGIGYVPGCTPSVGSSRIRTSVASTLAIASSLAAVELYRFLSTELPERHVRP